STVFLLLALFGAAKFHREARRWQTILPQSLLPVSVLKPLHGMEARLHDNLESFFQQDYPDFELLFAVDEPEDAALPVVKELMAKYPNVRSRFIVNGRPPWPNPPAYSFHCMSEIAQHDILVTSDSDVRVAADYLREVVAPLLDARVGMVTCVYRGGNAG